MEGKKDKLWKRTKAHPPQTNSIPLSTLQLITEKENPTQKHQPIFDHFLSEIHQNDFLAQELRQSEVVECIPLTSSILSTDSPRSSLTNSLPHDAITINNDDIVLDAVNQIRREISKLKQCFQMEIKQRIDMLSWAIVDVASKNQQGNTLLHFPNIQDLLMKMVKQKLLEKDITDRKQREILCIRIKQMQHCIETLSAENKKLQCRANVMSARLEQVERKHQSLILSQFKRQKSKKVQIDKQAQSSQTERMDQHLILSPKSTETKRFIRTSKSKFIDYPRAKSPKKEIKAFTIESGRFREDKFPTDR